MNIKKDDTILIICGKDKGKNGKVTQVFPKTNRIIVEGLNIVKRHKRPRREGEKGQRVEVPRPFDASNVKIICSKCKKAARIGYKLLEKNKIRICKKCGQEI